MSWLDFCYTVKRFTFNGNTLNVEVFERICPSLNLDWEKVVNEAETTTEWLNWKNKFLFQDGKWDVETLLSLGFLMCGHPSQDD